MANYPTSVSSFTTKNNGDSIQGSHVNDLQNEVAAIEGALLNGIQHNLTLNAVLSITGFGTHSITAGGTGTNSLVISNSTAGTGNFTSLALLNDASTAAYFYIYSSTYTPSGAAFAAGALLANDGAGGLSVQANHASGVIRFYTGGATLRTTINAAGTLVQAGTITIAGNSAVGPSIALTYLGTGTQGITINDSNAGTGTAINFARATVTVGSIVTTAGATAYNTSSDTRLKRDFVPFVGALDRVVAMRAGEFVWRKDGAPGVGLIAQELDVLYPDAVTKGQSETDMWSIDYGKLTPILIAAIQDLTVRLRAVEARR